MGLYERLLEEKRFLELEEEIWPRHLYGKCEGCGMPVPRNRTPVKLPGGRVIVSGWSNAYCDGCRGEE